MSRFKVLVTDYYFTNLDNERKVMEEIDAELLEGNYRTEKEVIENAKGVDALLVENAIIGRKVFEALPQLKAVGRYGIGVNVVDLKAATEHGVYVVNVPDYCYDEVSDHTLALLLASIRKINQLNNHVKKANWDYNSFKPIYRMRGRTLGLIGFGEIARTVAKKAKAFGLKIITADPFLDKSVGEKYGVKLVSLEKLLRNSDYISIHVPLTDDTEQIISSREFRMMKNTAFIINTSRGRIIDQKALVEALKENEIAGAAIDVLNDEPIEEDNPLIMMPNVIITPHVAYYSEESLSDLQREVALGVADVLTGKVPKNLANRDVLSLGVFT